jgi:hydroxypyruvate reductase
VKESSAFDPVRVLRRIYEAAVAAAQPETMMASLQLSVDAERTFVLAVGKAAVGMARYAHEAFGCARGMIVAPRSVDAAAAPYPVFHAAHPTPDQDSLRAGAAALQSVSALGADDTLLMLISGGASALMEVLPPDVTLDDQRALSQSLLHAGLSIGRMNAVRRRVSLIKGGRLAAAAWPARTVTLALSDVPGDALADIGSGPTIASDDAPDAAERILADAGIEPPPTIASWLRDARSRPPSAQDERLGRSEARLIGSPRHSLAAAATRARAEGFEVMMLGDSLEGDARELGEAHAKLALSIAEQGRPTALLSGGETTVRVKAGGRGGRNKTYLLAAAAHCAGDPRIWGLAADTDGIDGSENDAGAWFGPTTLSAAAARGVDASAALDRCDSYGFFDSAGSLIVTGPTGTNVNDVRVLLVVTPAAR